MSFLCSVAISQVKPFGCDNWLIIRVLILLDFLFNLWGYFIVLLLLQGSFLIFAFIELHHARRHNWLIVLFRFILLDLLDFLFSLFSLFTFL